MGQDGLSVLVYENHMFMLGPTDITVKIVHNYGLLISFRTGHLVRLISLLITSSWPIKFNKTMFHSVAD